MNLDPEKSAEEIEDHGIETAAEKTPGVFGRLLDALTGYFVSGSFTLDLRKKKPDA